MFWYDGKQQTGDRLSLSLTDPGLIYGATIFTTLRVYQQSLSHFLTHWQAHCDRLRWSVQDLDWQPPDWQQVENGAKLIAKQYPVVRISLFPDGREWITGRNLPADLSQRQQQGVKGWVAMGDRYRRYLPSHKTGNYLGAWLALQKAQSFGFGEAILTDAQGNWLETSTGNLWGWRDGMWYLPQFQENYLPGVGRSQLLLWFKQQQIPYQETVWTPLFVESLAAIAYSNSVVEFVPFQGIQSANNYRALSAIDPVIAEIKAYFSLPTHA
jgi:4-amino-4-deoxychorismate lyase